MTSELKDADIKHLTDRAIRIVRTMTLRSFFRGFLLGLMLGIFICTFFGCAASAPRLRSPSTGKLARWPTQYDDIAIGITYSKRLTDLDIVTISNVITAYNNAYNRHVFVVDQDHDHTLMQIEIDRFDGSILHSTLDIDDNGVIHRCRITLGEYIRPLILRRAISHELWHCLGYDDNIDAIGEISRDGYEFGDME
jgi:hypothetical protein